MQEFSYSFFLPQLLLDTQSDAGRPPYNPLLSHTSQKQRLLYTQRVLVFTTAGTNVFFNRLPLAPCTLLRLQVVTR